MPSHIMADLETFDTAPTALVLSLGATKFDPNTFEILDTFYAVLDLQTQSLCGRTKSQSTLAWWAAQSEQAQSVITAPKELTESVLTRFATFVDDCGGMWGNGASFDNVIIADLYRTYGARQPWPFWKDRCYRTVKAFYDSVELSADGGPAKPRLPNRIGTHHNALDDAVHQTKCLAVMAPALGLRL